jgi:integrase
MLERLGTDPAGCRDRALLLLGFAGALRRSELVGLDVTDISGGTDGLTVRLRHSKSDQEGAGRTVGIPFGLNPATCPIRPVDRQGHVGPSRLSGQAVRSC